MNGTKSVANGRCSSLVGRAQLHKFSSAFESRTDISSTVIDCKIISLPTVRSSNSPVTMMTYLQCMIAALCYPNNRYCSSVRRIFLTKKLTLAQDRQHFVERRNGDDSIFCAQSSASGRLLPVTTGCKRPDADGQHHGGSA